MVGDPANPYRNPWFENTERPHQKPKNHHNYTPYYPGTGYVF
jgi:hypothetical protein